MKKKYIIFLIFFSFGCFGQPKNYAENEIIVAFKKSFSGSEEIFSKNKTLQNLNNTFGLAYWETVGDKNAKEWFRLVFNSNQDLQYLIKKYSETQLFDVVEPNFIGSGHGVMLTTPNDPFYNNRQWSHANNGTFSLSPSTNDADIDTDLAWDITQGDPNLIVAVLDTGVKLDHPEFAGRIVAGYDFVNNDSDPTDDHGHGTNIAGIALASGNNGIGYAGVNWNSKIMPLKVLDNNNNGFYSAWADAIYFAVNNGAKVINLSAGGNSPSALLENAVNYAYANNVWVVVSTGNGNTNIQYPAKYPNAMAIGSTNPNDTRSNPFFWSPTSGSNYGPELDFVAPGNFMYGLSHNSNTNYNGYWGGTSQAAPHVTGVISLMLSQTPGLTVNQIKLKLQQTSQDLVGGPEDTAGWDPYFGFGRINAHAALSNGVVNYIGLIGTATESGNFDFDYIMTSSDQVNHTLSSVFLSTTGISPTVPGEVKFRLNSSWATNWGGAAFPSGVGVQDGPNIPITQSGYYNVAFNSQTGAYTFTLVSQPPTISIIGSTIGTPWNTDLNLSSANGRDYSLLNTTLTQGIAKFRQNAAWFINWGNSTFPSGIGVQDGPNIPITSGNYNITFNRYSGAYVFSSALSNPDLNSSTVSLFPNPATDFIVLTTTDRELGAVKIRDVLGKTLGEFITSKPNITIDCSSYPNGMYFISFQNDTQIGVKRVIIKR